MKNNDYQTIILILNALKRNVRQLDSQIKSIIEEKKLLWEIKKETIKSLIFINEFKEQPQNYLLIEKEKIKHLISQIIALRITIKHTCLHILESLKNKFPEETIPAIDFSFMDNDAPKESKL